jgi:hypothetical protein
MLHENPANVAAVSRLRSPQTRLIALHGFAQGPALRAVRQRDTLLNTARIVWRTIRRPTGGPAIMRDAAARSVPVLFLGRSLRFARFLMPLAESLRADCAFLVPVGERDVVSFVRQRGLAFQTYGPGGVPHGRMGRLISDRGRHLASEAQAFSDALARTRAKLVVVPEGNAPEDEVLARVTEKLGIASACVQQGWSPILHPAFHNLRYDTMLVWGDGFADLLASANPRQHFLASGNFHLAQAEDRAGQGILFLLQGFDGWLGGRHSALAMLALIEGVAKELPDRPVFVRPHPVVPLPVDARIRLERFANVHIEDPADVPLAQAFAKSVISVSAYSTGILESIAAGVVPVIFNTAGLPRYWPDVARAGAGLEIRDPEVALQALIGLAEPGRLEAFQEPMRSFSARFFKFRGAAAVMESVAALRHLAGLSKDWPAH